MKIYYLSATGNSLFTARELVKELAVKPAKKLVREPAGRSIQGRQDPVSLYSFREIRIMSHIHTDDDTVGFIFPVYFADIPREFLTCIQKMTFRPEAYIFAIATCNGVPGISLTTLDKQLQKQGNRLCAGFTLNMPGNALITPLAESEKRLKVFSHSIKEISAFIKNRRQAFPPAAVPTERLRALAVKMIGTNLVVNPNHFHVEQAACSRCGICQRVCPASNITLTGSTPCWEKNCIHCLACFHWCPRQAIRIGGPLSDRPRYHHPQIAIKDILPTSR